jgi:hypothetical protein
MLMNMSSVELHPPALTSTLLAPTQSTVSPSAAAPLRQRVSTPVPISLIITTLFPSVKSNPLALTAAETINILTALDVLHDDKQRARMGMNATAMGQQPNMILDLSSSSTDITKSMQKSWARLDQNAERRYKIPQASGKQTKKHLTDLLRMPSDAVKFLHRNVGVKDWDEDTCGKFWEALGVKVTQYYNCPLLHVTGGTIERITEEDLSRSCDVLRSTLLRRRLAYGVAVLAAIKQHEAQQAAEAAAGGEKSIVNELRQSVSELQQTLYTKDHTINRLKGKVERLQERVVNAGIVLSPSTPDDRGFTPTAHTTGLSRPLYREDAGNALPVAESLVKRLDETALGELPAVPVDSRLWADPRVASPDRNNHHMAADGEALWLKQQAAASKPPRSTALDPTLNRVPLKPSTAFFSPTQMTIHTTSRGARPQTAGNRLSEDDRQIHVRVRPPSSPKSSMKEVHNQLHMLNLGPENSPPRKPANPLATDKSLIRHGSPFRSTRRGTTDDGSGMPKLAKGTSHKAALALNNLWVGSAAEDEVTGFMYSASGNVIKKTTKKRRVRQNTGKTRAIGGVSEATRILEGETDSDDEKDKGGVVERDEDATDLLDDIVSGEYLEAEYKGAEEEVEDENLEPPVSEEEKQEQREQREQGQSKKVVKKDAPLSPMAKKLQKINKDVEGAQSRLDKQLRLLRGKGFARDPKSAQEIVEEVAKKAAAAGKSGAGGKKEKTGSGGGGGGGGKNASTRPRSPLKSLFAAKEGTAYAGGETDLRIGPISGSNN